MWAGVRVWIVLWYPGGESAVDGLIWCNEGLESWEKRMSTLTLELFCLFFCFLMRMQWTKWKDQNVSNCFPAVLLWTLPTGVTEKRSSDGDVIKPGWPIGMDEEKCSRITGDGQEINWSSINFVTSGIQTYLQPVILILTESRGLLISQ